jgi:hypothetical protein
MGTTTKRLVLVASIIIGISFSTGCDPGEIKGHHGNAGESGAVGGNGFDVSGGGSGSAATCTADFPCLGRKAKCVGTSQIQDVIEVGCSYVCGSVPCNGSSCISTGAVKDCPVGTTCRDVPVVSGQMTAECKNGGAGGSKSSQGERAAIQSSGTNTVKDP